MSVEMKAQAVAELEARSGSAAEVVIDSFIFQGCVEFYRSEYIEVARERGGEFRRQPPHQRIAAAIRSAPLS